MWQSEWRRDLGKGGSAMGMSSVGVCVARGFIGTRRDNHQLAKEEGAREFKSRRNLKRRLLQHNA